MVKKIISLFICFAAAFTVTVSAFAQSGGIRVEAASSVPLYLRYYYDQMDKNTQTMFLKMRKAILNCDKKITFSDKETDDVGLEGLFQVFELVFLYDPLTFNVDLQKITDDPKDPYALVLSYHYKKETYDKMVAAYEKRVDKILDKLTDDMSTYKKIKTIHDSIINTAVYDLEAPNNDNIYGTLVKKTAKCDGYAKTFNYICGKAGIKSICVMGDDDITTDDVMHMWNKVYYNKQWYNVDVTWDDPVSDLKKNIIYDYFMIDDETIFRDHVERSISFEIPEAIDDSKSYYKINNKYADDLENAKAMINDIIISAAKNNTAVVRFQCSSRSLFRKVDSYLSINNIIDITESLNKKTDKDIVALVPVPYESQYTFTIVILYRNTSLDSYFVNTEDISSYDRKLFARFGIK
ncbi:MAG: hypothetical protein J1F11_11285 [Oscillospiraceae bacterium]|nr:hypothetical protein [Oscillospiraceae bacterium]